MIRLFLNPNLWYLGSIILTYYIYNLGLPGNFQLDDFHNIIENTRIRINQLNVETLSQAALANESGLLKRPISSLTFALNYYSNGYDVYFFKLTNIFIHIMNGISLYILTIQLFKAFNLRNLVSATNIQTQWMCFTIASIWLMHPINLTSVLYVVQRMTSLATFFTIWSLIFYLFWRNSTLNGNKPTFYYLLLSLVMLLPLAVMCKESGALIPLYLFLIEWLIFQFSTTTKVQKKELIIIFSIILFIPTITAVAYSLFHPEWILDAYSTRNFTLFERLLTESRVIWFYIRLIIFPDISLMGLYHDDIVISQSLFQPINTIFSILGIAVLLLFSVISRKKYPLICFGILFFFAGHSLESTIFPLEIAFEHRNYFPSFGIIFVAVYYFYLLINKINKLNVQIASVAVLLLIFAGQTAVRASSWKNNDDFNLMHVLHHPLSPRSNYNAGKTYVTLMEKIPTQSEYFYNQSVAHFKKATDLQYNYVNGLFTTIFLDLLIYKSVEPALINELKYRLSNTPPEPSVANQLIYLVRCQSQGHCPLPESTTTQLFQAAIENPQLRGATKAAVLSSASFHFAEKLHDYNKAIDLAGQAIVTMPTQLQYQLNLIQILITAKQFNLAHKQLEFIKKKDTLKVYSNEIEEQERILIGFQIPEKD